MGASLPAGGRLAGGLPRFAAALLCFLTVGLVARSSGGWWPTTWGWAAIGLFFVAASALLLMSSLPLGPLDLAFLGGLAGLTAWTALSWIWSESGPETALEVERAVMYLGGVFALLAVARRQSFAAALGGLLAAQIAICGDALATRLAPDQVQQAGSSAGFRLAGVLGYPNALGITAVMAFLLALGFVLDSQSAAVRAVCGACAVPAALALYFSNSRGAWVALVIGVGGLFASGGGARATARGLAPLAASGALAIWLASRSTPLTSWTDPGGAAHDGHRMIVAAVALGLAVALVSARRSRPLGLVALVAVALAVIVAPASPAGVAVGAAGARGAAGPAAPGSPPPGVTPGGRFFSTSSDSRTEYWRVALIDFEHHPLAGSGAGTFVREWYAHRRIDAPVQDAHSLYLETLAELGLVGFALVAFALFVPLRAARLLRGKPLVAGAAAAYLAFVAHAAVDWDWELPGVTFAGLFCGGLLVVAARTDRPPLVLERRWRIPLLTPVLALLAFSIVGLVGNRADAASLAASYRGDWAATDADARTAATWAPWATEPLVLRADAASARGDSAAAQALLLRATRRDPSDYDLWSRLAAVSSGEERDLATARAVALDPLG